MSLSGEPKVYVKVGESGNRREQTFCANCGTPIYSAPPGNLAHVVPVVGTYPSARSATPNRPVLVPLGAEMAPELVGDKRRAPELVGDKRRGKAADLLLGRWFRSLAGCPNSMFSGWPATSDVAVQENGDLLVNCGTGLRVLETSKMMLWTAPTLRHRSAIGWLRRNAPH